MRDLTDREKFILGGAGAAAVLAFLPWVKVSFEQQEMGELFRQFGASGGSANGFSSADGVIAFLAALATIGLVLADRAGALPWPQRTRLLAPLVSAGVAMLCLLIFFGRSGGGSAGMVSVGRTFWFWLALMGMAFATFHAFQRWSEGMKGPGDAPFGSPNEPPPPPPAPPGAVPP